MIARVKFAILVLVVVLISSCGQDYNSLNISPEETTIATRISSPDGYNRKNSKQLSWKHFLQNLEVLPHRSEILDYRGNSIAAQSSHIAIINYDIGKKDLQQCADAVIRLRSEFLFHQKRYSEIQFKFTSGHNYKWTDHAKGIRPIVDGNKVNFETKAKKDNSYQNFRAYLDIVFMYAGTISLHRDLALVSRDKSVLEIGDVIIRPGSPGHAVLVVDRTENEQGESLYLLAEGYTPAQSIHILKSKEKDISPWFPIGKTGPIKSERFNFLDPNIRRFQ